MSRPQVGAEERGAKVISNLEHLQKPWPLTNDLFLSIFFSVSFFQKSFSDTHMTGRFRYLLQFFHFLLNLVCQTLFLQLL